MKKEMDIPKVKIAIGLRIKIIITFFILSSTLSFFLSYSAYSIVNKQLFYELQGRVRNLTEIGSSLINKDSLKNLLAFMDKDLTSDDLVNVNYSSDYKIISDQLNVIRDIEKKIIMYVYIFCPTDDENKALYVVDADALTLLEEQKGGAKFEEGEISSFNSEFDITEFQNAKLVIKEKKAVVDKDYEYDDVFKVRSISGFAPIFDEDSKTLLAVLGLDMADSNVSAVLKEVTFIFILIGIVAQFLALLASIILGTLFTKGIIYLERVVQKFGDKNFDVRADLKSNDEIGRLSFSFNNMASTIQNYSSKLERLLISYSKFVPKDFLRYLDKESILDVKLGDQVQKDMTILFSDIRSFTSLSEQMTPEENFNFINSYLKRVGPEIRRFNGFIDKYIGDAIMALFPTSVTDAVNSSISILDKVREYNYHRNKSGYPPISIGIGIHSGKLMLGTVGEHERMDVSVISDDVNLASRLEGLTKMYGCSIVISEPSLKKVQNVDIYHYRYLDKVQVKGKNIPVLIYEIFDGDTEELIKNKIDNKSDYLNALAHFYKKEFSEAHKIFFDLNNKNPDDKVYKIYMERTASFIKNGVGENWQGVEVIESK